MGSISVDTGILDTSLAELQSLSDSTDIADAMSVVSEAMPEKSSGSTAAIAKTYYEELTTVQNALTDLFIQTIAVLRGSGEYFTLTDEELARYIAQKDLGG